MKRHDPAPSSEDNALRCGPARPAGATTAARDEVLPAPPRRQGPRVAFPGRRIAWLTGDALVLAARDGSADERVPLGRSRGVTVVGDVVIAVGQDKVDTVVRVADAGSVDRWPAVLLLTNHGIVRLFGEPDRVWVTGRDAIVPVWLRLAGGILEVETGRFLPTGVPLSGSDQAEVARLAGGEFVILGSKGLTRVRPDGARDEIALPSGIAEPVLLASQSERRVWLAGAAGGLAGVDLGSPARVATCAVLGEGERVHSLAVVADRVAAVTVSGPATGPRWSVVVFADDGTERFRADLPWPQAVSDLPDVSVALGGAPASLAVATATRLAVWDLAAGTISVRRGESPQ